MAELANKFHCRKNGLTEEISVYTTLQEVQDAGINIKVGGIDGYMKYGSLDDANASLLNCKIPNDSAQYKIHKTAAAPSNITLVCKNVADDSILSSVMYSVPDDGVLYLNNDNAPSISGYDFVLLEGIKYTNVEAGDVFTVYYVSNAVANRALKSWDYYYYASTMVDPPIVNTYSATSVAAMFYQCSSLRSMPKMNTSNVTSMRSFFDQCKALTIAPELDTSKVTNMTSMFNTCTSLTFVPKLDTSKVTEMNYMFLACSVLTSIDWEIDMTSCKSATSMFYGCALIDGIRLKNVPRSLNLSNIGITSAKYTVVNYID